MFDLADLTGFVPLGGASVLLFYLLRVWLIERRFWEKDRDNLIAHYERQRTQDWARISELERELDKARRQDWDRRRE